jgi:acetyltransferase-like isoleucine patch superfamily enzyme
MKINLGYFWAKALKILNRPAMRDCNIDRRASVGSGSNLINVTMGKYSYMAKNNSMVNVQIGSFCSIASYCAIGSGGHLIEAVSTSPVFLEGRNALKEHFAEFKDVSDKPVVIGNDVWIGENVFIIAGVCIGDGAVIGAHSVVTHDIEPYAIVAGAPAKTIRLRFERETIEKLLEIRWWNWPDEKLKVDGKYFDKPEHLLASLNKQCNCK